MKACRVVLLCCTVIAAVLAYAQMEPGFQMAHVVSFEKGAADAQHMSDADTYKITMRMENTVYQCRANAPASTFMGWSMGKDFPARLSPDGKVLTVKGPNDQMVDLHVTKRKTAN